MSGDLLGSTGAAGLTLIDIDPATGAGTFRAPQGAFGSVTEMEFRADGTLIGATGGGASTLIDIDPVSGAESFRCFHAFGALNGLEFVGDTLYGALITGPGTPSELVIVGEPNEFGECPLTFLGPTGFGGLGGLAYDAGTDILYGCVADLSDPSAGDLVTCNPASGACTSIGSTGFSICSALEFGPDGTLFGGIGAASSDAGKLITVNPSTGAGTEVGPTGFPAVSGLAFVPQRTIIIDGCDTGVDDQVLNGSTISGEIAQCADGARNHGVAKLTNRLKKAGIITGREKGAIQSCAARADIP